MSKAGPCRIPTFGSRIPQIHSKTKSCEISNKQIGERVRIGEKEGILKFVGNVHFSKGVWCGIELTNSTGKNDGIVNGVRYFACADRCGLMAPQSKVSLLTTGSCESLNDDVSSGPYSMLFIEPKLDDTFISNENGIGNILEQQNDATERESLNSRKEFSNPDRNKANETFIGNQNAFLDNTCTYEILDKQNSSNSSDEFNDTIIETRLDETFNAKQHLNFTLNVNETISQEAANIYSPQKGASSQLCEKRAYEDNATYNFGRRRAFDLKPLNDTTNVSKNYPTFDFEKSKKRSSKVFDISLDDVNTTIINSANSLSPSVEVKAFATNQTETPLIERNLNYLPINKSCESLLSGSSVEVKRRRTSNPKTQKVEAIILKNLPSSVDKPSSLPQLRNSFNASSPPRSAPALNKLTYSTPNRGEFTDALLRKLRISSVGSSGASDKNTNYDDDSSKRNSLEFEESLGILTPDQMIDGTIFTNVQSRSPSLEYDGNVNEFDSKTQENCSKSELPSPRDSSLGILDESVAMKNCLGLTLEVTTNKEVKETELQSPNLTSMTDCSLGILDAQVISNLTLKTDTTVNMELPLDSIDKSKDFKFTRLEQTPSPEELPLDPTPVVESDSKTEPSKSKTTNNSFITSITSITSLDTGYQGDGEMSRPASRGPDNSPLTRRPLPRPQPRRPDPMTDSDFYTESDADNHEDNQLRGDRRAQVIDGTLYGVDPQAAADIYVNNRENMDSSGIFTDLENNTRNEEDMPNEVPDVSPSDASTKTISENSQNNLQEVLEKKSSKQDNKDIDKTVQKENPKKRNAPSPVVSNPSNVSSPRHRAKEENAAKKYKMPKRDVASKVKAMLEPNLLQQNEKKSAKKPVGRWDAVMKKISTNEQTKTNLKEVKSKVFDNVNVKKMGVQRTNERKPNTRSPGNPKSPSSKTRRIRNRTSASSTPKNIGSNVESSIHSSLSDLSAGTIPTKKIVGPAKKRDVVQVTQVLTANKLSPRNQQQQTALENKKNASLHPSSSNESKASRTIFSSKDKKQAAAKECGRGTVKGGRTSPSVRPPTQARVPTKQVPRVAEALAVLVQHLVFNVEAYQVPRLKRQVEKFHIETDELRLACRELEEKLHGERIEQTRLLEEERKRCQNDIDDLIDKHRDQLTELNNRHDELEQYLRAEKEQAEQNLCKQHEDQLITLKKEFDKLQRTHEESLDILREENNAIREQIDEKQLEVEKAKHESMKLKKDYENKEILFKEHNHKLEQQVSQLKSDLEDRIKNLIEENKRLRDENDRLLSYGDDKEIGLQEVQSLRAVLELKQKEVGELRKALAEASQKAEVLVGAEEKARFLKAKCEDLQLQLQRKSEYEQGLLQENQKLKDSFKEESNQKKRLSQHNEELKWKLKQNKEVISKVLEQTGDTASFNRSLLSSSFNEKHSSSKLNLERTLSFRERTYSNKSNISVEDSIRSRKSKNSLEFDVEDLSPPTSPKVKGVVEKSDSVSYVLDLDESPDVVASRIVRRSFRNTTPPKNTPTKSPCNKRPRIRMSLSQSASSSAIITSNRNEFDRPKSASVRNGECDNDNVFIWTSSISSSPKNLCDKFDESCESSNSSMKLEDHLDLDEDHDVDIQLPALPSELDRQRARPLPSPKHLAGESMVSESNSEDESTSSSQL
ncbi:uncharacterized protein LOC108908047 isoform X2 [Anoplophora glabripennis]|uniref:uncharacterized protein LOC108908047 isoform X2 n=1 Tax=Anoplophora glabripennis TaxID=217634 RepID=UPI00087421B6|nr:uncharacterized protein LOC108908047 isoform X2 [Anoplophora glabripennis]